MPWFVLNYNSNRLQLCEYAAFVDEACAFIRVHTVVCGRPIENGVFGGLWKQILPDRESRQAASGCATQNASSATISTVCKAGGNLHPERVLMADLILNQ